MAGELVNGRLLPFHLGKPSNLMTSTLRGVWEFMLFLGIPMYLNYFSPGKDIFINIEDEVLQKGSVLNEEVEFLLR